MEKKHIFDSIVAGGLRTYEWDMRVAEINYGGKICYLKLNEVDAFIKEYGLNKDQCKITFRTLTEKDFPLKEFEGY